MPLAHRYPFIPASWFKARFPRNTSRSKPVMTPLICSLYLEIKSFMAFPFLARFGSGQTNIVRETRNAFLVWLRLCCSAGQVGTLAMGISPTSSAWQPLAGSAIAYGITDGGMNATSIKLTTLGRRLVAPEAEGEDVAARREAVLAPRIMKEFFE